MSDEARPIRPAVPVGDLVFRGVARGGGLMMLLITGGIGVFLAIRALPTLRTYGLGFLTEHVWNPDAGQAGIASVITERPWSRWWRS